jgi:hypothetical protein
MEPGYLSFVIKETLSMTEIVSNPFDQSLIIAGSMSRFMNCDSLLDLSETYQIDRGSLYKAFDAVPPSRWLRRLMKRGRLRLVGHLRQWHGGDPSFRSRHAVTLCADDFTRTARGAVGGWMGLFYCGAVGGVVTGINVEALVAVIGDGEDVIILDIRIVPPRPEGSGRPPLNHNQWLRRALRSLDAFLTKQGVNLHGCSLSVDAAYVSPENVALTKELEIHMVGKLAANRIVKGDVQGPIRIKADHFAGLAIFVEGHRCRPLRHEPGVTYQRNLVEVPSLKAKVLMVTFLHEDGFLVYFTTHEGMKAITVRNVIRYRWQLERLFWILKQDIGIGDIHNHSEERVESRVYLHFILAQITKDAAIKFDCSPKDIVRAIRRDPTQLLSALGFPCAFAEVPAWSAVPNEPLAA